MNNIDKKTLRKYHRNLRSSMSQSIREELDISIFNMICDSELYKSAPRIFIYVSFGIEVDTHRIIDNAFLQGKSVAVPKCSDGFVMNFYDIESVESLSTGINGILEPSQGHSLVVPSQGDILIVPALSVDVTGVRLGFGGGYYDRYLARFTGANTICPCYRANVVERLPADKNDISVKYIVSENKFREAADE